MKAFLIGTLIVASLQVSAQSFEFELGIGSGQPYLIEHIDRSIDIEHGISANFYSSLIYRNSDSYFDLNLTFLNVNSTVEGTDWINELPLDGQVSTFTSFLSLEHLNEKGLVDIGYSFGLGYTREILYLSKISDIYSERNFTSLNISALVGKSFSDRIALNLRPMVIWTNPYNSFDSSDWSIASEDLSLLLNLGLSYRIN